jgi:hypothetical protein
MCAFHSTPRPRTIPRAWHLQLRLANGSVFIYASASEREHGTLATEHPEDSSILTYKLRPDGWVALQSAGGAGYIGTRVMYHHCSSTPLTINIDCKHGSARAQLTDHNGKPLTGYTYVMAPVSFVSPADLTGTTSLGLHCAWVGTSAVAPPPSHTHTRTPAHPHAPTHIAPTSRYDDSVTLSDDTVAWSPQWNGGQRSAADACNTTIRLELELINARVYAITGDVVVMQAVQVNDWSSNGIVPQQRPGF